MCPSERSLPRSSRAPPRRCRTGRRTSSDSSATCRRCTSTDLALACACAEGSEGAWDHFVREYRPVLYRSADAIDPGGGARELADSIYADLFGLQERDGERRSLFRYFHGRSSLATWLRAVLAQRQVDRVRATRRLTPLEEVEEDAVAPPALVTAPAADPDIGRFVALIRHALLCALALLAGSRSAAARLLLPRGPDARPDRPSPRRARGHRVAPARALAQGHPGRGRAPSPAPTSGLSEAEIARCFECTIDDPGTLDVGELFSAAAGRKDPERERSK